MDARSQVQVDQPGRGHLGDPLRDRLQPPAGARPARRGSDEFDWKYVNYAPFTVAAVIVAVGALVADLSARNTFEGPIRQVATDDTGRVIEGGEPDATAAADGTDDQPPRPPSA